MQTNTLILVVVLIGAVAVIAAARRYINAYRNVRAHHTDSPLRHSAPANLVGTDPGWMERPTPARTLPGVPVNVSAVRAGAPLVASTTDSSTDEDVRIRERGREPSRTAPGPRSYTTAPAIPPAKPVQPTLATPVSRSSPLPPPPPAPRSHSNRERER